MVREKSFCIIFEKMAGVSCFLSEVVIMIVPDLSLLKGTEEDVMAGARRVLCLYIGLAGFS